MENYLIYIGKAALAAGAFYLAYLVLFQNRKQFVFNRIYLPVSLALSFIIPLITFTTVKYIEAPATDTNSFAFLSQAAVATETYSESPSLWPHYLFGMYLLGIFGFLFHLLAGHFNAIRMVQKSRAKNLFGHHVHITKKDVHPFSFFSKIVLSEKTLNSPNLEMIVAHENIHVKEKHTLDILIAEILFLLQWFNPFAWLLKDAVKNNLEYKTDDEIVKTNDPQTYQLAMVALADKRGVAPFLTALNGSQLKNRIIMMKKKTENKFAPLKQLIILPLLAVLVMGLSNREVKTEIVQHQATDSENILPENNLMDPVPSSTKNQTGSDTEKEIKKFLLSIEFKDNQFILHGLKGCAFTELTFSANTKMPVAINEFGMTSAETGNSADDSRFLFEIEKVDDLIKLTGKSGTAWKELTFSPASKKHLVSEAGVSMANKPQAAKNETKTDSHGRRTGLPPSSTLIDTSTEPLYIIDGKPTENISQLPPDDIESISVLKNASSTALYGSKGKNGVILITTKSKSYDYLNDNAQNVRPIPGEELKNPDEMPQFPGGEIGLKEFIDNSIVYPERARKNGINGTVYVDFVISKSGKVTDARISRGVDPDLDKEALRIVNTLPPWRPGRKDGKLVDVSYTVPVDFVLKDAPAKASLATSTILSTKPLYILDGKETESIDDILPKDIESIDVLKGESATNLYGEKGKDGVIIITSKKYAEQNKITTEMELRKFIAEKIKYPVVARNANKEGTVQFFIELSNSGRVMKISEKTSGDEQFLDEVVVVGYKNKDDVIIKNDFIDTENSVLKNEVKRTIRQLPKIEMPEYEGKTVGITVKFMLQ
ncbi:TonB family C-terminal domain-containing protein [Tangfeifania diversioriginum]|uniref:TonB family C-terminal domain-containing protein n=1 Tax=Tangfeifania diversioriginum TaxID=1168035 RepID=A0A1M6HE87_9BACT|nr:M56 family metallopeptidase [Tangfeifania diversioriginum]SHJ20454.1 TonB family C-terminal domain-containing protein [Tangfeifania diversioriginum]